jgi:hypothetical protein
VIAGSESSILERTPIFWIGARDPIVFLIIATILERSERAPFVYVIAKE